MAQLHDDFSANALDERDAAVLWEAATSNSEEVSMPVAQLVAFLKSTVHLVWTHHAALSEEQQRRKDQHEILVGWRLSQAVEKIVAKTDDDDQALAKSIWARRRNGDELDSVPSNWSQFDRLGPPRAAKEPWAGEAGARGAAPHFAASGLANAAVQPSTGSHTGSHARSRSSLDVDLLKPWTGRGPRTLALLDLQATPNDAALRIRLGCPKQIVELSCMLINVVSEPRRACYHRAGRVIVSSRERCGNESEHEGKAGVAGMWGSGRWRLWAWGQEGSDQGARQGGQRG